MAKKLVMNPSAGKTFFLLFLAANLYSCQTGSCIEPVKEFEDDTISLTGPCPSHTDPLLIPVGDTMMYECEYQFPSDQFYAPLWIISFVSFVVGGPLLPNIHIIAVPPTTFLNFSVIEDNLNETINIQCGLCLFLTCDLLNVSIVSDILTLVPFSSPQSLTYDRDRDTVLLTWSSPVVASNYPVEFQYEVILINNNSQVIIYNITNNTSLNISREDIPDDYHVCSQYYWSMRSVVGERMSMIVQANETFSIPSAPIVTSGLQVNITECMSNITTLIQFLIISCQSPETLEYEVLISGDDDINITTFINYTSTDNFEYSIQVTADLLMMDQSLEDLLNESIAINITNDIGHDVTEYQILNNAELFGCPPSPSSPSPPPPPPPSSPFSTLSTPFSTPSIFYSAVSSFSGVSSSTPPTKEPTEPNNKVPFYIIGVLLVVIVIIIIIIIIVIILIYTRRRKKKVDITNGTGKETINRNGDEMAELVESTDSSKDSNTQITSDQDFRNLSEGDRITEDFVKLNPTYSTTEDIRKVPVIQQTVNNSEYAEVVQTSETKQKTLQQNVPITDTPGYSEPLSQVSGNPPEPTYSTPEHAIHHPPTLISHVPRNTSPLHGVVDTPGYTEVPGPFKKTGSKRGSKRKQGSTKSPNRQESMRSPKSPLPLLPTDAPPIPTMPTGALETDSNSNSHLYADIEEIKNKKHQGKNTTYVKLELSEPTNPTPSSQQRRETPYSTIAKPT